MANSGFDTSDMRRFIVGLEATKPRVDKAARDVTRETSHDLRDEWESNARRTAGAHGVHYPKAITDEAVGLYTYEIGPESAMPQGGMSFEYGSRNQPPHLDGNRAADVVFPRFERRVSIVVADAFK